MSMTVLASSAGGTPLGFEITGPFSTAEGDDAATVAALETTFIAGSSRITTAGAESTGLARVHPAEWFTEDPNLTSETTDDGEPALAYRGPVDAVAVLNDLLAISSTIDGRPPTTLSRGDAELVRTAVRSATAELQAGKDDGLLRSLRASIVFGADPRGQLAKALGSLAGVRVTFDLSVEKPNEAVKVTTPR